MREEDQAIKVEVVWQPTPVFWPGESHGQRSLAGYSPWGRTESDTTEVTLHSIVAIGPAGFSGLIIRDYATKPRLVNSRIYATSCMGSGRQDS